MSAITETKSEKPRLFVAEGCPFVLKVLIFLKDAGLEDEVIITADSPEHRAYVTEKAGRRASFPAIDLPDRVIMHPEVDELVAYLAEKHEVDMSSLTLYNTYLTGVFPRYLKMLSSVVAAAGGWQNGPFATIGCPNVLIIGGTGMVGQRLAAEARLRGHFVKVASRSSGDVTVNAYDETSVAQAISGTRSTVVVVAMGPSRTDSSAPPLIEAWTHIANACRSTGARVFFVGGAGSLRVEENGALQMDHPHFPAHVRPEAQQHVDALEYIRTVDDVDWTVLSPPPMIQPGKRTKNFQLGGDVVKGFQISAEDYAVAAFDEIETPQNTRKRFSVSSAPSS